METFSALLALCVGNSPVTDELPAQRPVTWSFDVFFHLHLNERLNKQQWGGWFEMPLCSLWRHCNARIYWWIRKSLLYSSVLTMEILQTCTKLSIYGKKSLIFCYTCAISSIWMSLMMCCWHLLNFLWCHKICNWENILMVCVCLWYLQYISNGDTAVLHLTINIWKNSISFATISTPSLL